MTHCGTSEMSDSCQIALVLILAPCHICNSVLYCHLCWRRSWKVFQAVFDAFILFVLFLWLYYHQLGLPGNWGIVVLRMESASPSLLPFLVKQKTVDGGFLSCHLVHSLWLFYCFYLALSTVCGNTIVLLSSMIVLLSSLSKLFWPPK